MRRVDQILSSFGYCTRSQARNFLRDERVRVDGDVVRDPSMAADPASVTVDEQPIDRPHGIFVALHKPAGYVCTRDSGEGQTIFDLLPGWWRARKPLVTSVGRLDKETTGIILVTDRGDVVHRLTSPRSTVEKVYEVTVDRPLDAALTARFAAGTLLLDGEKSPCLPARLDRLSDTCCTVTLTEGRYHQVRRMFGAVGYLVTALHRSRFGAYTLEGLAPGEYRDVPADVPVLLLEAAVCRPAWLVEVEGVAIVPDSTRHPAFL